MCFVLNKNDSKKKKTKTKKKKKTESESRPQIEIVYFDMLKAFIVLKVSKVINLSLVFQVHFTHFVNF